MAWCERERVAERMDDPDLAPEAHRAALRGLARINAWSGVGRTMWRWLARAAASSPVRVLDVACGGGDLVCTWARRAAASGLAMEFAGCDRSPTAVATAQASAADIGPRPPRFFVHDVLADRLPERYDIVTCTLFLHHLGNDEAATVLERLRDAASQLVLVDDLRRTRLGYLLAWAGCRLLSRSPVVHYDGPVSVRAAFTCDEVRAMADRTGGADWTLHRHWPQRFLLVGRIAA